MQAYWGTDNEKKRALALQLFTNSQSIDVSKLPNQILASL